MKSHMLPGLMRKQETRVREKKRDAGAAALPTLASMLSSLLTAAN